MKKIAFLLITLFSFQQNIVAGIVFGKTIDSIDYDDLFTCCIQAIYSNEIDTIRDILEVNPGIVHQQDAHGLTPLHHALNDDAYEVKSKIAALLVHNGAETDVEDNTGTSPKDLAEAYRSKIESDFDATDEDFDRIIEMYQSVSPDSPKFSRKRSVSYGSSQLFRK